MGKICTLCLRYFFKIERRKMNILLDIMNRVISSSMLADRFTESNALIFNSDCRCNVLMISYSNMLLRLHDGNKMQKAQIYDYVTCNNKLHKQYYKR